MKPIPVAFHVGPLLIHTYGLGLAATFWFAYRYFEHRLHARGYDTRWVLRLFVWVVVAAIVGARAMHVLANLSYYEATPLQVFQVWHGGLSSWGGLIGAVPTGLVVARRHCPSLRLGEALDIVAPVLASAWAIGRLLGPQLMVAGGGHRTNQWFGMYYADQVGKRLPVPIFQAIEDAAIFCILLYIERRLRAAAASHASPSTHPAGAIIGTGMVLWGIERVLDEHLWLAYPGHLGAELVQVAGVALTLAGAVVVVRTRQRWRRWAGADGGVSGSDGVSSSDGVSGSDGVHDTATGAATDAAIAADSAKRAPAPTGQRALPPSRLLR